MEHNTTVKYEGRQIKVADWGICLKKAVNRKRYHIAIKYETIFTLHSSKFPISPRRHDRIKEALEVAAKRTKAAIEGVWINPTSVIVHFSMPPKGKPYNFAKSAYKQMKTDRELAKTRFRCEFYIATIDAREKEKREEFLGKDVIYYKPVHRFLLELIKGQFVSPNYCAKAEAARIMNMSPSMIGKLIMRGDLENYETPYGRLITRRSLEYIMRKRQANPPQPGRPRKNKNYDAGHEHPGFSRDDSPR